MLKISISNKPISFEKFRSRNQIMKLLSTLMVLLFSFMFIGTPSQAASSRDHSALSNSRLLDTKAALEAKMQELNLRIDNQNYRLADQNAHISNVLSLMGDLLTIIAIMFSVAGVLGYVQVQRKARDEAQQAASKWFKQNSSDLIRQFDAMKTEFQKIMGKAQTEIKSQVQDVHDQAELAKQGIQQYIIKPNTAPEISEEAANALDKVDLSAKQKPEAQYTFLDWNNRAFAAYGRGDKDAAARFWRAAADGPDTNALNSARALLNSGVTLWELKRPESLSAYEEVIRRFGDATESSLRELVTTAFINKGATLEEMSRHDEAIKSYEEVMRRFDEPALTGYVVKAMLNKGISLNSSGRNEESVGIYDELLRRFSGSTEVAIQQSVAIALVNKGAVLQELSRPEEGIATSDEVLHRFGNSLDTEIREQVAKALMNKAIALSTLGRQEEAVEIYDDMLRRFSEATAFGIQKLVAMVFVNKGSALAALGRNNDAIQSYDELLRRFADADNTAFSEQIVMALLNKGGTLGDLGQYSEAISIYNQVLQRFGDSPDSSIYKHLGNAYNGIGYALLCNAKKTWKDGNESGALQSLTHALDNIEIALQHLPESPLVLGNKGYIHFLLGDREEAQAVLSRALTLGGEDFRQAELRDLEIHTLPIDKDFKDLLENL